MGFQSFEGADKARSSEVVIYPELGILRKIRAGRSPKNLQNEFMALIAWGVLLDHYSPSTEFDNPSNMVSPTPLGYDTDESSITMTFCQGLSLHKAIAGQEDLRESSLNPREVRAIAAYTLGRLSGIKELELLAHGDYQRRHLKFNPLRSQYLSSPRLAVIDVESTQPNAPIERVRQENRSIYEWLMRASSGKLGTLVENNYYEGFHSVDREERIWPDAHYVARSEAELIY